MQYIGFGTIYVPIMSASPEIVHYKGVTCWLLFGANFLIQPVQLPVADIAVEDDFHVVGDLGAAGV